MKNRTILTAILALALMGAVPAISNAANAADQQPQGKEMQDAADQWAAKEKIFAKYAEKMQPLEDQIFVKRSELRAMQNASQPDLKAVSAKAEEIVKLRRELEKLHKEMAKEAGLPAWGPHHKGPGFGKGHGKGHGKGFGGYGPCGGPCGGPGPRANAPCPAM